MDHTVQQLNGTACVICGLNYMDIPAPHRPVASTADAAGYVYACKTCEVPVLIPCWDLVEHVDSHTCICGPSLDQTDGGVTLITHHMLSS